MHGDSPFGNGYIDSAQSELSDKSLGSALTWINLNALFGWKLIKTDNKKSQSLDWLFYFGNIYLYPRYRYIPNEI